MQCKGSIYANTIVGTFSKIFPRHIVLLSSKFKNLHQDHLVINHFTTKNNVLYLVKTVKRPCSFKMAGIEKNIRKLKT